MALVKNNVALGIEGVKQTFPGIYFEANNPEYFWLTDLWSTAEGVEHVKEHKAGEGHGGVARRDDIVLHLLIGKEKPNHVLTHNYCITPDSGFLTGCRKTSLGVPGEKFSYILK